MIARLPLLAVVTATAVLCGTAVAGASARAPYVPRPHADFALRDGGLRIARFDVRAQPRGDRVLVSITLTARARTKDVRTVLRIGRCTGGPPTFPDCHPDVNRAIVLHPRTTTIVHVNGRVRRPSPRTNAIRISLTRPGQIVRPYRSQFVALVDLLLPVSAWTTFSGRRFGLRVARPWEGEGLPYDLTSVTAGAAQEDHDHLRATLSWTAALPAGTPVKTVAGPCPPGQACGLSSQTVANQAGRAGFGMRPDLARTARRQLLTFGARTPSASLFDLVMPWPR
jgi:hypothetical protein